MKGIREPVNFFTHVIPAIAALPAAWYLIQASNSTLQLVAAVVYGISGFVLFGTSSLYHGYPRTEKGIRFWQKFDHCCIYLMIAGSYTPTSLLVFEGAMKWILFSLIWTIALVGCLLKIFNKLQNNAVSLTIYILMGCLILPLISEMVARLPVLALIWMFIGGALYIGGTVFYYKDKPLGKYLHCHEIWHLFVVGGAVSHYIYNYYYLFA
jgi:hemolysin III